MHAREHPGIVATLIGLVVALICNVGLYSCTKSDCEERGGHIEFIWGGEDLMWQCEGAER